MVKGTEALLKERPKPGRNSTGFPCPDYIVQGAEEGFGDPTAAEERLRQPDTMVRASRPG